MFGQEKVKLSRDYRMSDGLEDLGRDADQLISAAAAQMHSAVSGALVTAFEDGGKAGVDSFISYLKKKILTDVADAMASAMLPSGGGDGDGGGGGFLGKLMGAGGASSPLGMALFGATIISSFLKKDKGAPQSGVSALPTTGGITQVGSGLDVLRGSDAYTRAAFSSRNISGEAASKFTEARFGQQKVEIEVKPSNMFDVEVKNRTIESTRRAAQGGTPQRTGFNLG